MASANKANAGAYLIQLGEDVAGNEERDAFLIQLEDQFADVDKALGVQAVHWLVKKDEFRIGKSKIHSDYAIENNTAISRVHVIVTKRNGASYLRDNESTNGTWIEGERLEPGREVLLKANMKVKFGDEDFTFYLREGV